MLPILATKFLRYLFTKIVASLVGISPNLSSSSLPVTSLCSDFGWLYVDQIDKLS
jgi:hypothetical protein